MSKLKKLINSILEEENYIENPYFKSLQDGSMSKEDFLETQIQFYFAVIFFPRPMAAAAAKIPSHEQRYEVVRNVWEEHGSGEKNKFHQKTFEEFLKRLGMIDSEELSKRKLWPEVRAFNTCLVGACVLDEYIVGVAALGMIELMFSDISSIIGKSITSRDFIKEEDLIHYDLHEKLDVKHADDFFDVLKVPFESFDEDRYLIEQGLRLGAHIFNQLYRALYSARKKRAFSSKPILRHSRS